MITGPLGLQDYAYVANSAGKIHSYYYSLLIGSVLPLDAMLARYGMVKKGKVFPYSLPSVGPGADPGVQAVSRR